MTEKKRSYCRKCLLEELGEDMLIRSLEELRAALPEEQKAENTVYETRLNECRKCDALNSGTCTKCGCYVEFRALKKASHCPHEQPKW